MPDAAAEQSLPYWRNLAIVTGQQLAATRAYIIWLTTSGRVPSSEALHVFMSLEPTLEPEPIDLQDPPSDA